MTDDPVDHDLTLLGLAERMRKFLGHIEDMGSDERVLVLGQFAGAVSRLRSEVRDLYTDNATTNTRALPALYRVMLALGADEDWAEADGDG
jgi:hypothetical protein